ncbi:MAG: RluA family pseudouridine synthase [Dissulfurispiraceae bacterium]|jgi:23S rRNA pseudouridine1911/1915/1917 synthase|nr:RluA family pseudouridine synthase [Dissulfurispiraceae bacterium]
MKEILTAKEDDSGKRLDVFVADSASLTRSRAQKLIDEGLIIINGHSASSSRRIAAGDEVCIQLPQEEEMQLLPEDIPLRVLYKDDFIAVVDKPAEMVVYPAAGHNSGTLLNALLFQTGRLASIGGPVRNGVVHRLDKDTTGVMVVALDDAAYHGLVEQFKQRTIDRKYAALVYGSLKDDSGEISLGIGRSSADRKKMSTKAKIKKHAVTSWRTLKRFNIATLIEARLATGRTHQIRVHFAAIGHAVLGDAAYGSKKMIEVRKQRIYFPRQMLHAKKLGFTHPATNRYMEFRSPLPEDMQACIRELEKLYE